MSPLRSLVAAALAFGLSAPALAQTSASGTVQEIRLIVNIPNPPANVTGFGVDVICRDLPGLAAGVTWTQAFSFAPAGGVQTAQYLLGPASNCVFRVSVLGTGPRSIFGTGFIIGGAVRNVNFPTTVNGQPVDAQTVAETDAIPVIVSTEAIFGQPLTPSTTTTTTTTSTTTTSTTTTTRPPTTTQAATTLPPTTRVTPPAPTVAPPPTVAPTVPPTTKQAPVVKPTTTKPKATKPKITYKKVRQCKKTGTKVICKTVLVRVTK